MKTNLIKNIVILMLITLSGCLAQEKFVYDKLDITTGWICTAIMYKQENLAGGTVINKPSYYKIEYSNGFKEGDIITTCSLDNVNRTVWDVSSPMDDCYQCRQNLIAPGSTVKAKCWTLTKIGTSSSGKTSGSPPIKLPSSSVNGSFLALNTIHEVNIAQVFIKSIASDNTQDPTYLGEYKFYDYIPKADIDFCNANIFQKKKLIKAGIYKVIAIEKTDNLNPLRFEKKIEIKTNECTFLNIDFNYSYLYYTVNADMKNEPRKMPANFADISIDNGPWLNQSVAINGEVENASLCKTNYPPLVIRPDVNHNIKARYTMATGEVKKASRDFILKENTCTTINLKFD